MVSFIVYGESRFSEALIPLLRGPDVQIRTFQKRQKYSEALASETGDQRSLGLYFAGDESDSQPMKDEMEELRNATGGKDALSRTVVLADQPDAAAALSAFRHGALDYLNPPQDDKQWDILVDRLTRISKQVAVAMPSTSGLGGGPLPREMFIGRSAKSVEAVRQGVKAWKEDCFLVTGESGTGKSVLVRTLSVSLQNEGNFVRVDCGAIAKTLFQSEMFGAEKGAFTGAVKATQGFFEEAKGGVLFLDEVGNLDQEGQKALLVALETIEGDHDPHMRMIRRLRGKEIKVWVKVVAATNLDLEAMVRRKEFSEALYFRLTRATLEVPPLRERPEDIEPLAIRLMAYCCPKHNRRPMEIDDEALRALKEYDWPGNIRELHHVIAYLAANAPGMTALKKDLPERITRPRSRAASLGGPGVSEEYFGAAVFANLPEALYRSLTEHADLESEEIDTGKGRVIRLRDFGKGRTPTAASKKTYSEITNEAAYLAISMALKKTNHNQKQAAGLLDLSRSQWATRIKNLEAAGFKF